MNPKYHPLRAFTLASLLLATTAHADLPLGLEGITPRQNRLDLGVSLTYYNHSNTAPRQGNSSYLLTPQNTLNRNSGTPRRRQKQQRHAL